MRFWSLVKTAAWTPSCAANNRGARCLNNVCTGTLASTKWISDHENLTENRQELEFPVSSFAPCRIEYPKHSPLVGMRSTTHSAKSGTRSLNAPAESD